MSTELNTLRVSAGRLEDEAKDIQILVDSYKERIAELQKDIEDHKTQIEELKHAQAREKEEEKEKRKQEMLNDMMSRIDMVSSSCLTFRDPKLIIRAAKLSTHPARSSRTCSKSLRLHERDSRLSSPTNRKISFEPTSPRVKTVYENYKID
jgi:kinesin family protein 5